MHDAYKIWDDAAETLAAVESRIHDGAPAQQLHARATGYVKRLFEHFPSIRVRPESIVVEVGSGVGYIMEAFAKRTNARRIVGLDVAASMIAHARERFGRDNVDIARFDFAHYDGVTFPWPDASIDMFYSVAAIQHIPKPFAYNVLFEMHRCLKPHGAAAIHVLGWDFVSKHNFPFAQEVRQQVAGATTHWHHFYDETELMAVIKHGIGGSFCKVVADGPSLWAAWWK